MSLSVAEPSNVSAGREYALLKVECDAMRAPRGPGELGLVQTRDFGLVSWVFGGRGKVRTLLTELSLPLTTSSFSLIGDRDQW